MLSASFTFSEFGNTERYNSQTEKFEVVPTAVCFPNDVLSAVETLGMTASYSSGTVTLVISNLVQDVVSAATNDAAWLYGNTSAEALYIEKLNDENLSHNTAYPGSTVVNGFWGNIEGDTVSRATIFDTTATYNAATEGTYGVDLTLYVQDKFGIVHKYTQQ